MWEEILRLALSNGLWAVCFVVLLVYVLKDSRRRENKYQLIINALTDKLDIVRAVKADTQRISEAVIKPSKTAKKETGHTELKAGDAA